MNDRGKKSSNDYTGNGSGQIRRPKTRSKTRDRIYSPNYGFGPHLMLDGYECNRSKLEDLGIIYKTLDDLPQKIGMTKIMPPYVFKYDGIKPEDWGISGFVLIAESHISIHTFPEKYFLSVDIFSCKEFDIEQSQEYLSEMFEIKRYEKHLLDRGREFPKDIGRTSRIVRVERKLVGKSLEGKLGTA